MKRFVIFLGLLSMACSKEKDGVELARPNKKAITVKILPKPIIGTTRPVLSDSIEGNDYIDEIRIYQTRIEFNKDSLATLFYRIHFLKDKEIVSEIKDKLAYDQGSEWYTFPDLMHMENDTVNTDRRFIEISNGFPACGYGHLNMLFFADENGVRKVAQNYSMADGEYGSYTEYIPTVENGKAIKFSSVAILRDESNQSTPEKEMILVNYSDSTDYEWENGKWQAHRRTPKEKVYRKKHVPLLHDVP